MKIFVAVLMIIFLLFLLLFISCFFIRLRIVLTAGKEASKKMKYSVRYEISVFGIKKELNFEKFKKKSTEKSESENDSKFADKVKNYYSLFCDFKDIYTKKSHVLYKNVRAEKIYLSLDFGYGDAAQTGILTGSIWAGIYNVIAFVARIIRINEPQISVTPRYNEDMCAFDGECIISGHIVNLISIVVSIGISYFLTTKNKKKAAKKNVNTN